MSRSAVLLKPHLATRAFCCDIFEDVIGFEHSLVASSIQRAINKK
jgi:hypothetical protein